MKPYHRGTLQEIKEAGIDASLNGLDRNLMQFISFRADRIGPNLYAVKENERVVWIGTAKRPQRAKLAYFRWLLTE